MSTELPAPATSREAVPPPPPPPAVAPQPSAIPPPPPASSATPGAASVAWGWQGSLPAPFNVVPRELVVVCTLMAAAAAFTLWPALRILPSILDALGGGGLTQQLG